jgi:hypothetical protein
LHGSAVMNLQALLERLVTDHPARTQERLLIGILTHQKLAPTPLAAGAVVAQFQVVRVFGTDL